MNKMPEGWKTVSCIMRKEKIKEVKELCEKRCTKPGPVMRRLFEIFLANPDIVLYRDE